MTSAAEVIEALFAGLAQQAPGSDASTARALQLVPALPAAPAILDLGAGTGRQTRALLRLTGGAVTAIDLRPAALRTLRTRATADGGSARLHTIAASIDRLPVQGRRFDLLWSEGAAYTIGFDLALRLWPAVLRPGRCLVVSELCWLGAARPPAARRFWERAYPAMRARDENRAAIAAAGLRPLADFPLPPADWWHGYYDALTARLEKLRDRVTAGSPAAAVLNETVEEIEVYRRHHAAYGYVVYVALSNAA